MVSIRCCTLYIYSCCCSKWITAHFMPLLVYEDVETSMKTKWLHIKLFEKGGHPMRSNYSFREIQKDKLGSLILYSGTKYKSHIVCCHFEKLWNKLSLIHNMKFNWIDSYVSIFPFIKAFNIIMLIE